MKKEMAKEMTFPSTSSGRRTSCLVPILGAILTAVALSGCSLFPAWFSSTGPNYAQVDNAPSAQQIAGIRIVDVNDAVARNLISYRRQQLFSEVFGAAAPPLYVIGAGDVIEVSIWEAPPAALFGASTVDGRLGLPGTRVTSLPEQMVNSDGKINIPFAGQVEAAGRSPLQIEAEIEHRLKGKANMPQVLVRVIRNNTSNVTVVGEVAASTRMPLTARGERLLDALAAAGGARQPVNKTTLQVTRGGQVHSLPLDIIIRDPAQNVVLQPGDVVTSLHQPYSFSVLGATGKNEEVSFEGQGISLAQALARAGGLQDNRADAQGVFIFRFESAEALASNGTGSSPATPDGRVPVIYRVDLKNPVTFFVAQGFPIQNKDVLYVSNAPSAELQKFLNLLWTFVYPIDTYLQWTR